MSTDNSNLNLQSLYIPYKLYFHSESTRDSESDSVPSGKLFFVVYSYVKISFDLTL